MKPTHRLRWRSDVAVEGFYLSTNGKIDPVEEWRATIQAFAAPYQGDANANPRCLYPARLKLVQSFTGRFSEKIQCPDLERWRSEFNAKMVTVVLASQYVQNPASIFGHIFLRFDSFRKSEIENLRLDTLAHSVGFFAQIPPDVNRFEYVYKGLGGGFLGRFVFSSYARSLLEYNQIEDRDLWEYELDVTELEIQQLIDHLWEMHRFGGFEYYFIRKNCAYQLLALLEAAIPRLQLTDRFDFYLVPSDAVRVLHDQGVIKQVSGRLSQGSVLRREVGRFSNEQKSRFYELMDGKKDPSKIDDVSVLGAAIDYIDYRTHQSKGHAPQNFAEIKKAVLKKRSELPSRSQKDSDADIVSPHLGHGPAKITAGFSKSKYRDGLTFRFRPAMHDSADGPGFPAGLSLELFDFHILFDPKSHKASWQQITLVNVENLREFESIDQGIAWRFKLGWDKPLPRSENIQDSLVFALRPGAGLATSPDDSIQFYALITPSLETQSISPNALYFVYGGTIGMRVRSIKETFMRIETDVYKNLFASEHTETRLLGTLGINLFRDWTSIAQLQLTRNYWQYEIGMARFF